MKNKNKYITIIGHSGYIEVLLKKDLRIIKKLKLIKSDYFYKNFVGFKNKHKTIIKQSNVIYYLTFNNDLKFAQKF